MAKKQKLHDHEQFRIDMEEAGFKVEEYRGRFYWQGPSVEVDRDELQDVIRATKVKLQSDNMGRDGLVVYPVANAPVPCER